MIGPVGKQEFYIGVNSTDDEEDIFYLLEEGEEIPEGFNLQNRKDILDDDELFDEYKYLFIYSGKYEGNVIPVSETLRIIVTTRPL